MRPTRSKILSLLALVAAAGFPACDTSSDTGNKFNLESITLQDGAVWQINRPIVFAFTKAVDFDSVNLTSINIRALSGANTSGEFFLLDSNTVVFQPTCPTKTDYSDAALLPGGNAYELTVVGNDQNLGFSVKSKGGQSLQTSERRTFTTPNSTLPPLIFFDPVVGPPRPRVRGRDNVPLTAFDATYVEVGGDPDPASRLYFEDTPAGVVLRDSSGAISDMPLNLYSQGKSRVAVVLYVNQPISPATGDPASGAVRWEYEESAGVWRKLSSQTELLANCTQSGALLRITPQGVLPPETRVRVVMTTSFADLTEDSNQANLDDFAVAPTVVSPTPLADEVFESFVVSAAVDPVATLHDFTASLADPPAVWDGGQLSPGFDFEGSGGPGGNFDVEIAAGQSVTWNTTSTLLVGGPNFVPSTQVVALGGIFDVDDLRVGPGALLKIEGPNPALILATGFVDIQGTIDCSGTGSVGVVTLNTTNVPEAGVSGQCGGGKGGTGSPLTNASSPRGGRGFGAFNIPDLGGQGGEAGWSIVNSDAVRRGAGGGGGVLGEDMLDPGGGPDETFLGLNAETGFPGANEANGAETGVPRPQGGAPGPSPFFDGDPTNDFFGKKVDQVTQDIVLGELQQPWAGSGGGGGGDASLVTNVTGTYPDIPFKTAADEKGAGGGGGGGSLTMLAIGPILWGSTGQIRVRGGFGGGGKSTNFVNRIGSASGGGSGGHVIVQSATEIDFSSKTSGANGVPAILASGGQGGAGADNNGGAAPGGSASETTVAADACPPPATVCLGEVVGAGGDGGPGLVQLHTPDGTVGPGGDIKLPPAGVALADICYPTPLPPLLPQFGQRSAARSVWIRLGLGGFDFGNPTVKDPVFTFNGTDPTSGAIVVNGTTVASLPSILPTTPPPVLATAPTLPYIAADEFTLVVDASTVPSTFKDNPALLLGYLIDLDASGTVGVNFARYAVAFAAYDATADTLALTVPMSGPKLTSFGGPGTVDVRLRPAFFRVQTAGVPDEIPDNAEITVRFQAAPSDPLTEQPDELNASLWVDDISQLNMVGTDYRFIRFEAAFDIDKNGVGLDPSQALPMMEYLRLPFQY